MIRCFNHCCSSLRRRLLFLLIFYFTISLCIYSYELRLHFANSSIRNGEVVADVYVSQQLPEEVVDYVQKSIVVVLSYRLELKEKKFFFDRNISSLYFNRKIYYDFIKEEYVIVLSESGKEVRATDFDDISKYIYDIKYIYVTKSYDLNNESTYYYRSRLSLTFINAYPYLDIFFTLLAPIKYRIKWLYSKPFKKESIH